jgi:putative glutamine amidotransferase
MRLLLVSQRVDIIPGRQERRDALDQRLVSFLCAAGFLAVPVPNRLIAEVDEHADRCSILSQWTASVRACGLVLSGGNDVGDCPERDATETLLLQHAHRNKLPVLGICRGLQMMSTWSGGRLTKLSGHVRTRHMLHGVISGEANSYHNIGLTACPKGFSILARSEDGAIEAIGHDLLPWEGWMWHPEREKEFSLRDIGRTQALFNRPSPLRQTS